jgi:hypothetical protein
MGRLALMMVMGLTLTFAMVSYQINQTNERSVEHVVSFDKYTTARNIAHAGVNIALRAFDRQPADTSLGAKLSRNETCVFANNFMQGICTTKVWLVVPNVQDSLYITSKAKFMDTTYTMKLKVRRTPVPFPSINAAVSLNVANLMWAISGNSAWIDGHNHDSSGNLLPSSLNDLPGVAVLLASDTSKPLANSSLISGSPCDVIADSNLANPAAYASTYINAASYTYTGPANITSNLTWGSSTTPVIVYANATGGTVKFAGNTEGWGILICKGNLTMSGTFKFHGLVIAYNDVTITEEASLSTGTPDIIGGFLMAGAPGSSFTLKGNCSVLYSSAAIKKAMLIGVLQAYKVCDWYE